MTLVYIDSGVLIDAAIGKADAALRAVEVLDDPDLVFASSIFVKLEVLPKALYYKHEEESQIYQDFFANKVVHWARINDELIIGAFNEAVSAGLSAVDALHVVAAVAVGAEKIITTERITKPLHRTKLIHVKSINP